jgi:uncharacterized protein
MPPPTEARVYVATPTLRLNGQENERWSVLLLALAMTEQAGGLSSLELRFSNAASLRSGEAELAFDAGGDLELGAEVVVGAGEASAPVEIFKGFVTGIEGVFDQDGPPELVVLAEDALQRARWARRTRVYEDMTLADITRAIARQHGLTPTLDGLDQNFGVQVQVNETDLGFLRRLLARVDADVQVVGGELHAAPRSEVRRGEIELTLGTELKSVRILTDLAHQITRATARGWDVRGGTRLDADGQDTALGPGEGEKGGDVLSQKFGERTQHLGRLASFNQGEVEALANTVRNRRARQFVRAEGVTTGTPALRVGTHVRLTGVGDWFSNTFYVVKARHLFDQRLGYRTEFEAESAFRGREGA